MNEMVESSKKDNDKLYKSSEEDNVRGPKESSEHI